MPTVQVVELVQRAQIVLQDTTGTRWPELELQMWLNDAYREILLHRPDTNTQIGEFACVEGTRQRLTDVFPSALSVDRVVRNLAASSRKGAIRAINQSVLDDQRRTWHAESPTVDIELYMIDPLLPREFFVYPPASTEAVLEVVYSSVPDAHTLSEAELQDAGTDEPIRIVDSFANAILDYMLYRAYSKDAEYMGNAQRAVMHREAMLASMGVGSQTAAAVTQSRLKPNPQDVT